MRLIVIGTAAKLLFVCATFRETKTPTGPIRLLRT